MNDLDCTFCDIVSKRLPSHIHFEDDEIVVFENELDWVPVMLLLVPRRHMTQTDLWNDGAMLGRLGAMASKLGHQHAPNGFRILSNFGADGLQSQPHGHLHVIGGAYLGRYVARSR
jgi:histidine triad (HIT) family protein